MLRTRRRPESHSTASTHGEKSVRSRRSLRFLSSWPAMKRQTSPRLISVATVVMPFKANNLPADEIMRQLFDDVFLLEGQVGKRPIYLPVLRGKEGVLLLDTGCAEHVDNLILPGFSTLDIQPQDLRFVISTHPDS